MADEITESSKHQFSVHGGLAVYSNHTIVTRGMKISNCIKKYIV